MTWWQWVLFIGGDIVWTAGILIAYCRVPR